MMFTTMRMSIIWISSSVLLFPAVVQAIRMLPNDRKHPSISSSSISSSSSSNNRRRVLMGTKVNVPTPSGPDDHLVTDLPLLDTDTFPTKHWAGLLPASDDGHKYLFYWLFAPDNNDNDNDNDNGNGNDNNNNNKKNDEDIPLIIWLNGGPACSSMDGLWLENGPFRLTKGGGGDGDEHWKIELAEHSWHKAPAYVLYIDQPVGTGIAFTTNGKYPKNDQEVNTDFYYFLQQFFDLHQDKFVKTTFNEQEEQEQEGGGRTLSRDLYFTGESHAGHYIPSMMNYIQQQNSKSSQSSSAIRLPLAGAAIGNGWIDPVVQYSAHEAAYGFAIVGLAQKRSLQQKEVRCQTDLQAGKYVSGVCFDLLDDVVGNSQGQGSHSKVSQYDARKWESKNSPRDFPPGHRDVEAYLGGNGKLGNLQFLDVLKSIHSLPSHEAGQVYRECTDPPYNALKHQDGLGVTKDVVDLLDNGVRMLFFNGIHDLICNHVGNEIAVENFQWKFQNQYQTSKRYGWKSDATGNLGGYMKEYQNLMYLKVLDSGHMVPMDVPNVSLDMMKTFVFQGNFDNYEQNLDALPKGTQGTCPKCPEISGGSGGATDAAADAAADACPTCPVCPTNDDHNNVETFSPNSSSSSSSTTTNTSKYTIPEVDPKLAGGVLIGLVLVIFLGCCWWSWWCCCRRPQLSKRRQSFEFDMELPRQGGRFKDEPQN